MDTLEKVGDCYRQLGHRIKERRKSLRISQEKLGEMMGISYQQVQKYESGASQLSVDRLLLLAHILNVPPSFFYEGFNIADGEKIESDVICRERSNPLQILLVEDNPADALLFSKAAESSREEISLHCINNSETVMDYIRHAESKHGKPTPDLVILDLSLPKITGLQLLKQIKQDSSTQELPVLILTNSISKKEMQEAYRLGASGFIQKSIDVDEYKSSISTMINYWSKVVALPTT